MVVIIMGAAGAGKTTVGRALADELGWRFVDADDHHDPANVQRMRAGSGLDDSEREAWLARLRAVVERAVHRREPMVLACSALKAKYRNQLRAGLTPVRLVYLKADRQLLHERLASRRNHFAGPGLIETQLGDLEEPTDALIADASRTPEHIVARIRAEFGI